MARNGLERVDGVWHVMAWRYTGWSVAREGLKIYRWIVARNGLEGLDGMWHVMPYRDWMECGTYGSRESGWSVARNGLERLDGVWHVMARRDWMECGT